MFNIVALYSIFGGAVGGALVGLTFAPPSLILIFPSLILIFIGFGIPFGLIPAFLTGCWLAWRGQCLQNSWDVLSIFLSGFVITLMLLSAFTFTPDIELFSQNFREHAKVLMRIALIGGLSSVIVGIFALPKDQSNAQ